MLPLSVLESVAVLILTDITHCIDYSGCFIFYFKIMSCIYLNAVLESQDLSEYSA